MSENENENVDLSVETEEDDDLVRQLRAQIREERKGRTSAESRLQETTKSATFKDLGIDIEKGPGRLLYQHYEGEISPEAIKTAAEEYEVPLGGAAKEPTPPPMESSSDHPDANAHRQMRQDANDGGKTDALPTGREKAQSKYEHLVNSGRTNEEAMAGFFSELFNQAMESRKSGA